MDDRTTDPAGGGGDVPAGDARASSAQSGRGRVPFGGASEPRTAVGAPTAERDDGARRAATLGPAGPGGGTGSRPLQTGHSSERDGSSSARHANRTHGNAHEAAGGGNPLAPPAPPATSSSVRGSAYGGAAAGDVVEGSDAGGSHAEGPDASGPCDVTSGHKSRSGKRRRRRGRGRVRPAVPADGDRHPATAATPAGPGGGGSAGGASVPAGGTGMREGRSPDRQRAAGDRHAASAGTRHGRRRGGEGHQPPAYAALDLGTNNCRLLIATPTRRGQFRVVDAYSRIVRLGQGLGHSNALDGSAMDRAVAALAHCAGKLEDRAIRRRRLIATEACRRAENGPAFIDRVREETGLALEIVDRRTEAYLAVAGCSALIARDARASVLFDIGGGSTEIALLDLTRPGAQHAAGRAIVGSTSLPVGVVTLSERYGGAEVTPNLFERMVGDVSAMIEGFADRRRLGRVAGTRHFHLLGTSGTVTTLAGLHLRLPRYERRRVDGLWMTSEEVDRVQADLVASNIEQRRASPCIGSERADLVLAGCAILEAIRREWPSQRLRVADRGLREGMLTDMMISDDGWSRAARARAQRA